MSELKNCPFCKGEVEIRTQGNDYSKKRSATMRCKNGCNINMKVSALTHNFEWCEEKLTERWNTRPIESALLEALKEKKSLIAEMAKELNKFVNDDATGGLGYRLQELTNSGWFKKSRELIRIAEAIQGEEG